MGAGNSIPQTTHIDNPNKIIVPIQITPSVVQRLAEAQKSQRQQQPNNDSKENEKDTKADHNEKQQQEKPKCSSIPEPQIRQPLYELNVEEIEHHFHVTQKKLQNIIGQPLTYDDPIEQQMTNLRKNLMKCYEDHPGETLNCSAVANKYQQYVFSEQFRNIKKFANKTKEENQNQEQSELLPPPPFEHSPPYN